MQDTSLPAPDTAPSLDANQPAYKNEVTVNASALTEGDAIPEVGDEVELTVKGLVSRISGDTICVTPTETNGEPSPPVPVDDNIDTGPGGPGDPGEMDAQREKLLQGAMAQDKSQGY